MTSLEFWKDYLKSVNKKEDEALYSGELVFEDSGFTGQTQLSLVLSGAKTAVFTPLEAVEINRERPPVPGEVYIVLDSQDEPRCIIELTDVNILPFNEIPWDLAKLDGENENLEDWRSKMRELIQDEGDICGFQLRENMKIVAEIFRVIYKKAGC